MNKKTLGEITCVALTSLTGVIYITAMILLSWRIISTEFFFLTLVICIPTNFVCATIVLKVVGVKGRLMFLRIIHEYMFVPIPKKYLKRERKNP